MQNIIIIISFILWKLGAFLSNFQEPVNYVGWNVIFLSLAGFGYSIYKKFRNFQSKINPENKHKKVIGKIFAVILIMFLGWYYGGMAIDVASMKSKISVFEKLTIQLKERERKDTELIRDGKNFVIEIYNYLTFPFTRKRVPPVLPAGFEKNPYSKTVSITVDKGDRNMDVMAYLLDEKVYKWDRYTKEPFSGGYVKEFEWKDGGQVSNIKGHYIWFFETPLVENPQKTSEIEARFLQAREVMKEIGFIENIENTKDVIGTKVIAYEINDYKCLLTMEQPEIEKEHKDVYGNITYFLDQRITLTCGPNDSDIPKLNEVRATIPALN